MKKINSESLYKIAKKEKGPYLIKFGSKSCPPCNAMKPVLELLEKNNPSFSLYEVDTEESPDLAQHFQIRSIPTIHFCKKREIIYSFVGSTPLGDLQYVIDNIEDPYFLEHGEFQKPDVKKNYTFELIIAAVVLLLVLGLVFL